MKDSILIFGGGELQISILKKAMALGFNTIVIDPNPLALAAEIADVFIHVEGNDFSKTLEIAQNYDVKGVVTAATDHPILMMCRIAQKLGLNFPSYSSCDTLLDKGKFKAFLSDIDIPHANGNVYSEEDSFNDNDFQYPVIIKPVKNSGSRGVIKCEKYSDLSWMIKECIAYCKDGRFIIEKYISGDEISVEAIVINGQVEIIQITDKYVSAPPYNVEMGHIQPSMYMGLEHELSLILQKIIDASGFDNCVIHPEFKITEDGDIFIIEIGTRLGGDYITSDLTPLSTGVDIEILQILIAVGKPLYFEKINKWSAISFLNFSESNVIKRLIDQDALKLVYPEVNRFNTTLKVGDSVSKITNSLERYGYFIVQGLSRKDVESKCDEVNVFLQKKFF